MESLAVQQKLIKTRSFQAKRMPGLKMDLKVYQSTKPCLTKKSISVKGLGAGVLGAAVSKQINSKDTRLCINRPINQILVIPISWLSRGMSQSTTQSRGENTFLPSGNFLFNTS